MIRYTKRVTGNKNDKARCFVPFYTEQFFATAKEDGEIIAPKEPKQVKFPVKLNEAEEATRANTTYVKVNAIDYFDSDVERLLGTYSVIDKRLIKPKNLGDDGQEAKQFLAFLTNVCTDTARSTLENVKKDVRQELWDNELAELGELDVTEENIVNDEQALFNLIENDWDEIPALHDEVEDFRRHLNVEYKRRVMNHLHQITFGADAYRAHKIQAKYLREQICKPYGATVEASFRRIDVLANMMEHFPPICKKATMANKTEWILFDDLKTLNAEDIRDIKYNILPASYQDKIDNLEEDWTEMTAAKFLSEAQKCEIKDLKERNHAKREKSTKDSKKGKKSKRRSNGDDSDSDGGPPKRKKNGNFSNKKDRQTRGGDRPPRECILCKLAGAPETVYKSHFTNQCNRVDQHSKNLKSGSSRSSFNARKNEQRITERDDGSVDGEVNLAQHTRKLEKQMKKVALKKRSKKKKKAADESGYRTSSSIWHVDSSSSDEDSDF